MNEAATRVLIADDEALARSHIEQCLRPMPRMQIVAQTENGPATLGAIRLHQPELIFLDIQMPGLNGLEVARQLEPSMLPAIIFVTAYDRYAVPAFDLCVTDYLLKPFDDERFERAVARALARRQAADSFETLRQLRMTLAALPGGAERHIDRIAVESRGQLRSVLVRQIDYISASGVYAELHVGDRTYVVRERMQVLEERLDPREFIRIHRSLIVRLDRIDVLLRQAGADYTLRLTDGTQLPVSRSRIADVERWMGVTASEDQPE